MANITRRDFLKIAGVAAGTLAAKDVLAFDFLAPVSGGAVGDKSHGTWQETGPGKWQYRGTGEDSEGVISAIESEHDLATRTLSGKNYEWK